jgi:hypothetical protein
MSSLSSILIAGGVFAIALSPAALAAMRPGFGGVAAVFYGIATLAAASFHTGIFSRDLAPHDFGAIGSQPTPGDECAEVLQLLQQARVIIDRRDPARLVVARAAWEQLPSAVRDAATFCADRARPEGENIRPLEVVPQ